VPRPIAGAASNLIAGTVSYLIAGTVSYLKAARSSAVLPTALTTLART
jgi:hypothetical protein